MKLIADIFNYILLTGAFLFAVALFIQTNRELWENFKEDYGDWFKSTRIGMWFNNRKNGVTILTDDEYENLQMTGKIIPIEVVED